MEKKKGAAGYGIWGDFANGRWRSVVRSCALKGNDQTCERGTRVVHCYQGE